MGIGASTSDVGAGALRELFAFDRREFVIDDYGNEIGDWVEQFRSATGLLALKGGESVQASRLAGRQPYIATIRYSNAAAAMTTDWRCRDIRSNADPTLQTAYALTTHVPRPRKDYIDLIIVEGVADTQVVG